MMTMEELTKFMMMHPLERSALVVVAARAAELARTVRTGGTVEEKVSEFSRMDVEGRGPVVDEMRYVVSEGLNKLAVAFYEFMRDTRPEAYHAGSVCNCPKCRAERAAAAMSTRK